MSLDRKPLVTFIVYFLLLIITGYTISYYSNNFPEFNKISSEIWFITFSILTLSFSPIRELITPLFTLKPFKKMTTYIFIGLGLLVPYVLLKLLIKFEILLNRSFIVTHKNGLYDELSLGRVVDATVSAPIWEELFFRGILLFTLMKLLKPFWAIVISSVIFALFHPLYLIVAFVLGIILSIMVYRTKSLLPSMVTHSTWNLYASKLFIYF